MQLLCGGQGLSALNDKIPRSTVHAGRRIRNRMVPAKAVRLQDGFGLEHLQVTATEIAEPGPGMVHVRFHAASLNYRDLSIALGTYNTKMQLPRILGSDAAGEMVAVGEGVTEWKPGDRVASVFFQNWHEGPFTQATGKSALGGPIDGVFATDRLLPAGGLIAIPETLSFEQAATLPCAAVTAWNALVEKGRLHAGQTVLILGTGGVSLFALQIAKAHGARIILTSSSDEKLARGRALGADETINYKAMPAWDVEVQRLTNGRGADHIVEVGGSGTLPLSLNAAALNGYIYLIGVLSEPGKGVDVLPVLRKSLHLEGVYVGSRAMFSRLNAAMVAAGIEPVVDRSFALEDARAAFAYLQSGDHFGKVALSLGS